MAEQPEWISLSDALAWLSSQLASRDLPGEMVVKTIRQGGASLRGVRVPRVMTFSLTNVELLPDDIDGREVRDFDLFDIIRNELKTRAAEFHSVEINRLEFEQFVRAKWPAYFQRAPLLPAPEAEIERVIAAVYDEVENAGTPPNIKQLPNAVLPRLEALGWTASKTQIMEIGRAVQAPASSGGKDHARQGRGCLKSPVVLRFPGWHCLEISTPSRQEAEKARRS
jgi:hypothetical protein